MRAVPQTVPATAPRDGAVAASPGPVVGSICTGYGGLDLGVLAAFGGGRIAWCADPDPHIRQILAARLPGVPNLGDIRGIDWTRVTPVDVLTAGFPCLNVKLDPSDWLPKGSAGFVDHLQQSARRRSGRARPGAGASGCCCRANTATSGFRRVATGRSAGASTRSQILAPGRPDLDNRYVGSTHGVLDAYLVTGTLGNTLLAPTGDLAHVGIRDGHTGDRGRARRNARSGRRAATRRRSSSGRAAVSAMPCDSCWAVCGPFFSSV